MADTHSALVAHLFRRAGFGLRSADKKQFPVNDYPALVEALVNPPLAKRDDQQAFLIDAGGPQLPVIDSAIAEAQRSWVRSMVTNRAPLVERMTLFLSNHFATSQNRDVNPTALVHQQATIRKHALGNFAELTHAMVDDMALARYLNNDRNWKGHGNENFGRELMELFLLGPGNYTEKDVKEVARALTGYKVVEVDPLQPKLVYDEKLHDNGAKTILGTTAAFTPHGVTDFLLAQPAAKRFIATRLVATFVSPEPNPTLVGAVAKSLHDWNLQAALRTIFTSSHFRAEAVRQSLPKTPVEYVAGMMRGLRRIEYDDGAGYMSLAGHTLFRPPSVAGWPMGKRMLGSGAMLARYNSAVFFANEHVKSPAQGTPRNADVNAWIHEFGIDTLAPRTQEATAAYKRDAARLTTAARTAGALTVLLSSPDFQLA